MVTANTQSISSSPAPSRLLNYFSRREVFEVFQFIPHFYPNITVWQHSCCFSTVFLAYGDFPDLIIRSIVSCFLARISKICRAVHIPQFCSQLIFLFPCAPLMGQFIISELLLYAQHHTNITFFYFDTLRQTTNNTYILINLKPPKNHVIVYTITIKHCPHFIAHRKQHRVSRPPTKTIRFERRLLCFGSGT